jgi:hypothetical protein
MLLPSAAAARHALAPSTFATSSPSNILSSTSSSTTHHHILIFTYSSLHPLLIKTQHPGSMHITKHREETHDETAMWHRDGISATIIVDGRLNFGLVKTEHPASDALPERHLRCLIAGDGEREEANSWTLRLNLSDDFELPDDSILRIDVKVEGAADLPNCTTSYMCRTSPSSHKIAVRTLGGKPIRFREVDAGKSRTEVDDGSALITVRSCIPQEGSQRSPDWTAEHAYYCYQRKDLFVKRIRMSCSKVISKH